MKSPMRIDLSSFTATTALKNTAKGISPIKIWAIAVFIIATIPLTLPVIGKGISTEQGWHKSKFEHAGLVREYRYFIPSNYIENLPVVVLLHGGTQSMKKLFSRKAGASKQWPTLAEKENFVLLVPNGTNPKTQKGSGNKQNWNDCRIPVKGKRFGVVANDVGFISELIDWSSKKLHTDTNQVFVTGASNGGMMSYRLAMELPEKITAVAAFIANLPVDSECKAKNIPIPIMIFNGTKDPFMPWSGGEIKGDGGKVVSTQKTVDFWLANNHSDRANKTHQTFPDLSKKDKSKITGGCYAPTRNANSAKTCFYQVNGGGHVTPSIKHDTPRWLQKRLIGWQNKDLESADFAWSFFLEVKTPAE